MADTDIDKLERRVSQMVAQRQPLEYNWQEAFQYLAPERSLGWQGTSVPDSTNTTALRARIYDDTAIDACEVLKSTILAGTTPANSLWFNLDAGQNGERETAWMDGATEFIFTNIHASNFDTASNECLSDEIPAGWMVMYIEQARDTNGNLIGGYNFQSWPLNQCYIACSKPGGIVDTIARIFTPTVEQMVSEYGYKNLSDETKKKFDDGLYTSTVEVAWVIEPNRNAKGILAKNLPFKSTHYERTTRKIIRESGYEEFPCAVPRWSSIPGTPYATGMGSKVLPTTKTLNQLEALELKNLDIAVNGMWKAADDGVLNPRTVRIGARQIIMVADVNNLVPLTTGVDFNIAFAKADDLRQQIRRIMMTDQLTPAGGPVRSATEIQRDVNQVRTLLSPILSRQNPEYLQVVIERCFGIALRSGALEEELGPIPEGLLGKDYTIRYISPLARSQKMEEVNAIDVFMAGIGQLAAAKQDPTVWDNIKVDESQYEKGLALGVPSTLLRGPEELQEKRQLDMQVKQDQEQAAQEEAVEAQATQAVLQPEAA